MKSCAEGRRNEREAAKVGPMSAGGNGDGMSHRRILYERKSVRIERDEDGTCHFVQTLRDGPFYELPISRWKALFFLLAAEMEDALKEPVGRRHTADAIAQLVAA